jgi:hypothetical protein
VVELLIVLSSLIVSIWLSVLERLSVLSYSLPLAPAVIWPITNGIRATAGSWDRSANTLDLNHHQVPIPPRRCWYH